MKLATSELKQGPPLMILLQDILRVPDRAIRGRAVTKGIAAVAFARLSEVCPDRDARRIFLLHILKQGDVQLDRQLVAATSLNAELAALFDGVIVRETELGLGDRVYDSDFVTERVEAWKKPNVQLYDRFRKAVQLGEQRRRGDRPFPLTDALLPNKARDYTDELKTARRLLLRQFPRQRHELSDSDLAERFRDVVARGACPNLAATCDQWCSFFAMESHRALLRSLANARKVGLRGIVLEYFAHYTGHTALYVDRALRRR